MVVTGLAPFCLRGTLMLFLPAKSSFMPAFASRAAADIGDRLATKSLVASHAKLPAQAAVPRDAGDVAPLVSNRGVALSSGQSAFAISTELLSSDTAFRASA